MVKIKNRYIAIEIKTEDHREFTSNIPELIKQSMKVCFGDIILSKIVNLEVCEHHRNLNTCILKCNLDVYKYICYILATQGSVNGLNTHFRIILVSGILKKLKMGLLKHYKKTDNTKTV